jgi:CBS domain-containing protein
MDTKMNVQSILNKKGSAVATIAQQATIQQAAYRMSMANIGALIATDGKRVVGILTNRDIVRAFSNMVGGFRTCMFPMRCARTLWRSRRKTASSR